MMENKNLKPCPFCGCICLNVAEAKSWGGTPTFYVECNQCQTSGRWGCDIEEAKTLWNTRPIEDKQAAIIAAQAELIEAENKIKGRNVAMMLGMFYGDEAIYGTNYVGELIAQNADELVSAVEQARARLEEVMGASK